MPRKTSTAAATDHRRADYDRWRLLARNGLFRKDVAAYLNNCGPDLSPEWRTSPVPSRKLLKKIERLQKQFLAPWGIEHVPDPALWQEAEPLITPEGLERWYHAARDERADFTTRIFHPAGMSNIRRGSRPDEMFVEFRLDTSLPVDQLIALMDREFRSWYWKHLGEHPRGKPASLDFHLNVFDLCCSPVDGTPQTFLDIARKLRRTPSTIRDAYLAACRKIGISSRSHASATESLPGTGAISTCPDRKCRNAATIEDFCPAHKAHVMQDGGSQKDLLVHSLSKLVHAIAQKASGRKKSCADTSSDD